jgi:outer membrane protein assembly factor BamE (lipoprotein component of BamABCDE complex)
MYKIIILSFALALAGCASYGTKIDQAAISKMVKGKTTETEVRAMLGDPVSVGITPDGKKLSIYMYSHAQRKASSFIPIVGLFVGGAETKTQTVQIWYDDKGVVINFTYNNSNVDINTGLLAN